MGGGRTTPFAFLIMWNYIQQLASAVKNDVVSGLRGYHQNLSMSIEQLEQDIIDERLRLIKEYQLKGILPTKDLLLSINCIPVDCKNIEKCTCATDLGTPTAHFEIPQLLNDYGIIPIEYLGTIDKTTPFLFGTSIKSMNMRKYGRRIKNKPYVFIDVTPNEHGMLDCFLFNAPLLKTVSITAIFKDPRQLENYSCCTENKDRNFTWIDSELKDRVTKKKLYYYRQLAAPLKPNDQQYTTG